jgi:hypothetical protein
MGKAALKSAQPTSRRHEIHTDDITIEQPDPIAEADGRTDLLAEDLASPVMTDRSMHAGLSKELLAELAFNEEPVTVMFTPNQERFAAPMVDAYCQNRGIEVLTDDGVWLCLTQVPVNVEVTMRRKFVEIFARCKHTDVKAHHGGVPHDGSDPINNTLRSTNLKHPFVLIEDKNPVGREWLKRLIMGRA